MTNRQKEIISDNLRAFVHNFGEPTIVKEDYGKGFYVFRPGDNPKENSWVQYCYDINYLNGWLYGCVQAACGQIKTKETEE